MDPHNIAIDPLHSLISYYPVAIAIDDVSDDGFNDIITANNKVNNVSALLGQGEGSFLPAKLYFTGANPVTHGNEPEHSLIYLYWRC